MRYADKINARFSVVIGDTELENGKAVLKNMESKECVDVELNREALRCRIFAGAK
jgi:histidyl-tRNA synthetase